MEKLHLFNRLIFITILPFALCECGDVSNKEKEISIATHDKYIYLCGDDTITVNLDMNTIQENVQRAMVSILKAFAIDTFPYFTQKPPVFFSANRITVYEAEDYKANYSIYWKDDIGLIYLRCRFDIYCKCRLIEAPNIEVNKIEKAIEWSEKHQDSLWALPEVPISPPSSP